MAKDTNFFEMAIAGLMPFSNSPTETIAWFLHFYYIIYALRVILKALGNISHWLVSTVLDSVWKSVYPRIFHLDMDP